MRDFLEKRKEKRLQEESLALIKQHLSDEFKHLILIEINNIIELSDMILFGVHTEIKARIDESNFIHIKIEDINGFLYEGFTQNYTWFLQTFSFKD